MKETHNSDVAFMLVQAGRMSFLEGPADQPFMGSVEDVRTMIEQCFSHGVTVVLLYAPNLCAVLALIGHHRKINMLHSP